MYKTNTTAVVKGTINSSSVILTFLQICTTNHAAHKISARDLCHLPVLSVVISYYDCKQSTTGELQGPWIILLLNQDCHKTVCVTHVTRRNLSRRCLQLHPLMHLCHGTPLSRSITLLSHLGGDTRRQVGTIVIFSGPSEH